LVLSIVFNNERAECTTQVSEFEEEIVATYTKGIVNKNFQPLEKVCMNIDSLNPDGNKFISYWKGYANFLLSFGIYNNNGDKELARKAIDKALENLNKANKENPEDGEILALLSMAHSFSTVFLPGRNVMKITKLTVMAKELCTLSMAHNNKNIRAYLALIMSEYYSTRISNDHNKADKYCLEAIYKAQSTSEIHQFKPDWGKNIIYYYLVSHYKKIGNINLAKAWADDALDAMPGDELILMLQKKLN